uniref:MIER family member 2 n=1 Tax=Varanus komodoensis TaxID=61221 RepID=A0A8D2JH28_VARKO
FFFKASIGRQRPRIVPYPVRNLCPGRPSLHTTAVLSVSSANHRFNLAEILSQNYRVREEAEEEEQDNAPGKATPFRELEKSFNASQSSEMPFEELLAFYGYEASDPISEQESESSDAPPNLPDMTLDKEQIAKDLLSGEEEEETQSSADDLTPSVISHDASDLFPNQSHSRLGQLSLPSHSQKSSTGTQTFVPTGLAPALQPPRPPFCRNAPCCSRLPPQTSPRVLSFPVYENDDQLLWDPNILPEREVEEFLYRAIKRRWDEVSLAALPEGETMKDNEQALYELVKCNFNAEEALRRLRFNVKVIRDELCAWSEEECRNFEHGFRVHGKNFHLIQANKVRTRSVGECVEYYYMWKKSERYDYFTQQTRFGRKKYVPHPGATCVDLRSVTFGGAGPQVAEQWEARSCPEVSGPELLGQPWGTGTPSETNGSFDPAEEVPVGGRAPAYLQPPPKPPGAGFCAVATAGKQEPLHCSGEAIAVGFALPGNVAEGLPLIPGHVGLDRDPETLGTPAQVSLSVPNFSILGIGEVSGFLDNQQACPAPRAQMGSFSQ